MRLRIAFASAFRNYQFHKAIAFASLANCIFVDSSSKFISGTPNIIRICEYSFTWEIENSFRITDMNIDELSTKMQFATLANAIALWNWKLLNAVANAIRNRNSQSQSFMKYVPGGTEVHWKIRTWAELLSEFWSASTATPFLSMCPRPNFQVHLWNTNTTNINKRRQLSLPTHLHKAVIKLKMVNVSCAIWISWATRCALCHLQSVSAASCRRLRGRSHAFPPVSTESSAPTLSEPSPPPTAKRFSFNFHPLLV